MREKSYQYGGISFEWDEAKAKANAEKHGVTFAEAASTWDDDEAVTRGDPAHSWEESRFLRLGISSSARLLLVVHCYRGANGSIRIVSARRATKKEEALYAEFRRMA